PVFVSATVARWFWLWPKSALSANRKERQENFRYCIQRPGHRDNHANREHLLGLGERLRTGASERKVASICPAIARQCKKTIAARKRSCNGRHACRSGSLEAR